MRYKNPTFWFPVIAIILGYLSARVIFVSSWLSLIPWGIIGLTAGYSCRSKKQSLLTGILYGYFLTLSFLFSGYQASFAIPHITRFIIFSLLFSLIGALCGFILAYIGFFIRKLTK